MFNPDMASELFIDVTDPVPFAEIDERAMVKRVESAKTSETRMTAVRELVSRYCAAHRYDDALLLTSRLLKTPFGAERRPSIIFLQGTTCEGKNDYQAAADRYTESIVADTACPPDGDLLYWQLNNLAFSFNCECQFEKAERLARLAIQLDSHIPNAWKNLGVSLEYRGFLEDAALAYIASVRVSGSTYKRAVLHLERLSKRLWYYHGEFKEWLAAWLCDGRARSKRPDRMLVYCQASALDTIGRFADAIPRFEKYCVMAPVNEKWLVEECATRIRELRQLIRMDDQFPA